MGEGERHSGTILVVEDDDLVLRTARRILTRAGYDVLQADTVEQAWAKQSSAGDDLRLVLTDHSLPDGDGLALARRIRAERPALPILIMTGWDLGGAPHGDEIQGVVRKPFDRETLLEAVRGAIAPAGD